VGGPTRPKKERPNKNETSGPKAHQEPQRGRGNKGEVGNLRLKKFFVKKAKRNQCREFKQEIFIRK